MIWKVSWRSKNCPDNSENVCGWYKKCPDDLESIRTILKCPDNLKKMCRADLKSVRMICKIAWRSKKCPDNQENVSGWYGQCPADFQSVWMIWKVSWRPKNCPKKYFWFLDDLKSVWIIWKISWRFKRGCNKYCIYSIKKSIKCLRANSFPYKYTLWSISFYHSCA